MNYHCLAFLFIFSCVSIADVFLKEVTFENPSENYIYTIDNCNDSILAVQKSGGLLLLYKLNQYGRLLPYKKIAGDSQSIFRSEFAGYEIVCEDTNKFYARTYTDIFVLNVKTGKIDTIDNPGHVANLTQDAFGNVMYETDDKFFIFDSNQSFSSFAEILPGSIFSFDAFSTNNLLAGGGDSIFHWNGNSTTIFNLAPLGSSGIQNVVKLDSVYLAVSSNKYAFKFDPKSKDITKLHGSSLGTSMDMMAGKSGEGFIVSRFNDFQLIRNDSILPQILRNWIDSSIIDPDRKLSITSYKPGINKFYVSVDYHIYVIEKVTPVTSISSNILKIRTNNSYSARNRDLLGRINHQKRKEDVRKSRLTTRSNR